jgi:endonuclease YncB( thermonuclease family)
VTVKKRLHNIYKPTHKMSHGTLIVFIIKTVRKNVATSQQAQTENWSKEHLLFAIKRAKRPIDPNQTTILKRPTDPTFLYEAEIIEVIDGDTLLLNIDLGFGTARKQRVRLSSLNCPEINTQKGQDSYHFLRDKMSQITTIMIKTRKIDIYGRYLGHIFYDETGMMERGEVFNEGVYLNEEILVEDLAEVV